MSDDGISLTRNLIQIRGNYRRPGGDVAARFPSKLFAGPFIWQVLRPSISVAASEPSCHDGLPLENESRMVELFRESTLILMASEMQLFDMFADTLYRAGQLTASRGGELAQEARAGATRSRALFEAGFAVTFAVRGLDSPSSLEITQRGNIEADVFQKMMVPSRRSRDQGRDPHLGTALNLVCSSGCERSPSNEEVPNICGLV